MSKREVDSVTGAASTRPSKRQRTKQASVSTAAFPPQRPDSAYARGPGSSIFPPVPFVRYEPIYLKPVINRKFSIDLTPKSEKPSIDWTTKLESLVSLGFLKKPTSP